MTDHPVTPTPELRRLWAQEAQRISPYDPVEWMQYVSEKAAQWGADTELEACCEWLESEPDPGHVDLLRSCATALRSVRRPSLQSLKEKALKEMDKLDAMWSHYLDDNALSTIRRALEALPDD